MCRRHHLALEPTLPRRPVFNLVHAERAELVPSAPRTPLQGTFQGLFGVGKPEGARVADTHPFLKKSTDLEVGMTYYSPSKVSLLVEIISTALLMLLIVVSITILYSITSNRVRVFCVALFTLLFSVGMAMMTNAGRLPLLVASAT